MENTYLRFKGITHEWIPRTNVVTEEYRKYAKLPLVPVVATPERLARASCARLRGELTLHTDLRFLSGSTWQNPPQYLPSVD